MYAQPHRRSTDGGRAGVQTRVRDVWRGDHAGGVLGWSVRG